MQIEITGILLNDDSAAAMGTYHLKSVDGEDTKAEFTFEYRRDPEGHLRIVLHHSSLPFSAAREPSVPPITEEEVRDALKAWGDAIVEIGAVYQRKGNYREVAVRVLDTLYGYGLYVVLFKPTKAAKQPFRETKEGALSYFIGDNPKYSEDHGFAIHPWTKVRIEPNSIVLHGETATATKGLLLPWLKSADHEELRRKPTSFQITLASENGSQAGEIPPVPNSAATS